MLCPGYARYQRLSQFDFQFGRHANAGQHGCLLLHTLNDIGMAVPVDQRRKGIVQVKPCVALDIGDIGPFA